MTWCQGGCWNRSGWAACHVAGGVVVNRLDSAQVPEVSVIAVVYCAVGRLLLRGVTPPVVGHAISRGPAQVPRLVDAVVLRGRFQPVQGVVTRRFRSSELSRSFAALNVAGLIVGVAVAVGRGVVAVVAPDLIADPAEAVEGGIGVVAAAVVQLDLGLLEILGGDRVEPQVAVGGKRLPVLSSLMVESRFRLSSGERYSVVCKNRAIQVGVIIDASR